MFRFFLYRLLQTIVVLYMIASVVFFMMKMIPGGPFSQERNVSAHILDQIEKQYGLNDPVYVQYFNFIKDITPKKINISELANFDLHKGLGIHLGYSFRYEGRSVNELIKESFPVSLELGIYALIFATLLGILLGIYTALNQNSIKDYIPMSVMTLGICIPAFVLGPLLILLFGFIIPEPLKLPVMLWNSPTATSYLENIPYKILPTLTLGFYYAAAISRLTRGSMIEAMNQDFIQTARAKGLPEFQVVFKHGLKSGIVPIISYLGPISAHLITGSFIVEFIFMIPGLGRHLINASLNRDYTLIMGTVLLYATILIVFNFLVDIAVAYLNPKVKLANQR